MKAGIMDPTKVWIAHTEYTIAKKQLPGECTQYVITDMHVVSQQNGKCLTWDKFYLYFLEDKFCTDIISDICNLGLSAISWRVICNFERADLLQESI